MKTKTKKPPHVFGGLFIFEKDGRFEAWVGGTTKPVGTAATWPELRARIVDWNKERDVRERLRCGAELAWPRKLGRAVAIVRSSRGGQWGAFGWDSQLRGWIWFAEADTKRELVTFLRGMSRDAYEQTLSDTRLLIKHGGSQRHGYKHDGKARLP